MTDAGGLLILGARGEQLPAFAAAKRRGLPIATIDPDRDAPGMALADEALVADLADEQACLAFAGRLEPAAVLTFAADYPMPMVAVLAEDLGLPGPSSAVVDGVTDKLLMRRRLENAGVAVPGWRHVTTVEELVAVAPELGDCVVVKPRRSSGSRGVRAVAADDPAVLHDAFAGAVGHDRLPGVLVEELVTGPELSIEAVVVGPASEGVAVVARTAKSTSEVPEFVEIAHHQPCQLDKTVEAEVDDAVSGAVAALGLDRSLIHAELRCSPAGPVMMEVAARAGGGAIASDLVPLTTGVDLAEVALTLALGERPSLRPRWSRGAAVQYFNPSAGRLVAITGIEQARAMDGVERIDLWVAPGVEVAPLEDSRQRVGRLIASGPDGRTASQRAAEAAQAIRFEVSPPAPGAENTGAVGVAPMKATR